MLKGAIYLEVVTVTTCEEGLLVRSGNPKSIRIVEDLADPSVTLINRKEGSGTWLLLDQRLRIAEFRAPLKIAGMIKLRGHISKWPGTFLKATRMSESAFALLHNCLTWTLCRSSLG